MTLIVLGILVETVKKSVLQAQSLRALAKNDQTDLDREIGRTKKRATMKNCLLIIQNWTR